MFTGIIETTGIIKSLSYEDANLQVWVACSITHELKIDQSVAHNGVCLTVVEIKGNEYRVTAVAETLVKTNMQAWKVGDEINLERALKLGDRLDGHFVQGHVDSTGVCIAKKTIEGSRLFQFQFDKKFAALMIEKGSVCINGVSLTAFHVGIDTFEVTIIPYTYQHTNFNQLIEGGKVNLEFDVLGKYLLRQQQLQG